MGVEQIMRDEFQAAREYLQSWDSWERDHRGLPPRRDLELEAIGEILQGKRWIHCHSYRQDEIVAFLRVAEEFSVQVGCMQHILEGYKVADVMRKHGVMASSFSDWWAYKFEVFDSIPQNGAILHQAGVVVSFNSDDRELARHLNQEAAKAVRYGGVDPLEAFQFVTLNPAKQLRIDQFVGSLEVGKHADLVVWNAPPLSIYARPEQTWVDGRRMFDRTEDLQLRQEARQLRATLVQRILDSGESMRELGQDFATEQDDLWPRDDEFCHEHPHQ
jgi:N-acetylglucosamine-6-phosphate deacetylase